MRPIHRFALLATVGLAGLPAGTARATSISEFPTPVIDQQPSAIAATSGGHLWFGQNSTAALGALGTNGTFGTSVSLSGPAAALAVASSGAVWATEPGAQAVTDVSGGTATNDPISVTPQGIAAGPNSTVWVTVASPAEVLELNGSSGSTEQTYSLPAGSDPTAITEGSDGSMWFIEAGGTGAIGRITTGGVTSQFTGLTVGDPTSITAGSDGNIWFTESQGGGAIGRITSSGSVTEFTQGLTVGDPTSITSGPGGDLWFTASAGSGAIGRITTGGTITEFTQGLTDADPTSITEGSDGNLWFTAAANPGAIGELTPTPDVSGATAVAAGATSVTVTGTVNPNGEVTVAVIQWGTTTGYGHTQAVSLTDGTSAQNISQTITGLTTGTPYHFRIVAVNLAGTTNGADGAATPVGSSATTPVGTTTSTTTTSTTKGTTYSGSTTATTTSPGSTPTPAAPTLDHTAVAAAVSGAVTVTLPGASTPVTLSSLTTVPLGAVIDATHGTVRITDAITATGKTQAATVWGGRFSMTESKSGMTVMHLADEPACTTGRVAHAIRTAPVHLWAHDHDGRYSTRGRNSVATVRGTIWETIETCAGTRTVVRRGVVSVRNLNTHRAVLVHAGHSYLARS